VPPAEWMATIGESTQPVNEERLFALLKAIKETNATGFESDAATDFTPWGLAKPFLRLTFEGETHLELQFGTDGKGGYYANRTGTPVVMSVDPQLFSSIPVMSYEWRHSRVWSVDRTQLVSIDRQAAGEPAVRFQYDFQNDEWTAAKAVNGVRVDLTALMDPARANYLLGALEGLKVSRWLQAGDPAALAALATPSLAFAVTENRTDDDGNAIGRVTRQLMFSPASQAARPGFYYGCLISDGQPFLLDPDTYSKLATAIIEPDALQ
jgi:Domain of unknown function (DUF4340)